MEYDVTVIGSGPGGYVAAIRCAQLGMKTAIVEKYDELGGTCLNVGCIPSKALLDSSEHYHDATHKFKHHGIEIEGMKINFKQMIARKNDVVKQSVNGVSFLMKKNKIDVYHGIGSFTDKNTIGIAPSGKGEKTEIQSKRFIIATGSKPALLPFVKLDKKRVITSTEALNMKEIPKHLILIGGGIIGMELGSVFARLGSKITVIEMLDNLIPTMDHTLGKELQKVLRKQDFDFRLSHKVVSVVNKGKEVLVSAEDKQGNKVEFKGDYCLISIGRKPYTEGLGLEKIGLNADKQGRIEVDENLKTPIDNIYAIGDVIKGPMLAHKAEEEGVAVAERMAGQKPHINYNLIPSVVYTWPEVASVGYTEGQLKEKGKKYTSGSFPFKASGRSRASMDTDGLVKVLADLTTDEILGVHIIGPRAADMIAEAVVAMEFRASAEDIARMSHAHPTYSEAFKEACLAATGNRALHL
jgi:dihydrolipoamide dehydrogenase